MAAPPVALSQRRLSRGAGASRDGVRNKGDLGAQHARDFFFHPRHTGPSKSVDSALSSPSPSSRPYSTPFAAASLRVMLRKGEGGHVPRNLPDGRDSALGSPLAHGGTVLFTCRSGTRPRAAGHARGTAQQTAVPARRVGRRLLPPRGRVVIDPGLRRWRTSWYGRFRMRIPGVQQTRAPQRPGCGNQNDRSGMEIIEIRVFPTYERCFSLIPSSPPTKINKQKMITESMKRRVINEVEIHWQLRHHSILELYNYFEDS
ncbi:MAG: hypothetical protein BJ554DRAFT_972, partial [Olpidium bornovanus]